MPWLSCSYSAPSRGSSFCGRQAWTEEIFLAKALGRGRSVLRIPQRIGFQERGGFEVQTAIRENRDKLFTFLRYDGVPWNNNNAEHAIKAFARLRNIIGGSSTAKGLREYLVLLSLSETCKCKGLSFLDFLRSQESNVDNFASRTRRSSGDASRRRCMSPTIG